MKDWNEVRIQAAIAAMQAIVSNNETFLSTMNIGKRRSIPSDKAVVVISVELADALIAELKKVGMYEEKTSQD